MLNSDHGDLKQPVKLPSGAPAHLLAEIEGAAEVDELQVAVLVQQQVLGFQVPMHHLLSSLIIITSAAGSLRRLPVVDCHVRKQAQSAVQRISQHKFPCTDGRCAEKCHPLYRGHCAVETAVWCLQHQMQEATSASVTLSASADVHRRCGHESITRLLLPEVLQHEHNLRGVEARHVGWQPLPRLYLIVQLACCKNQRTLKLLWGDSCYSVTGHRRRW